jgi:hypothetical protein
MAPMSAIVAALLMAGVGYAAFRLGMSRVGAVGEA